MTSARVVMGLVGLCASACLDRLAEHQSWLHWLKPPEWYTLTGSKYAGAVTDEAA